MKGLIHSYDLRIYDDEELQNDVYKLDRIICDERNDKVSRDDLRWCNELWKKYKCSYSVIKEVLKIFNRTSISYYTEMDEFGYEISDFIMKDRCFLDDEGGKNSKWIKWNEDGEKILEGNYKHSVRKGTWTEWYWEGKKKSEVTYKNGKKDGLRTHWDEDGQIIREETYKNGVRHGLRIMYNDEGKIIDVGYSEDGKSYRGKLKVIFSDDGKSIKDIKKL